MTSRRNVHGGIAARQVPEWLPDYSESAAPTETSDERSPDGPLVDEAAALNLPEVQRRRWGLTPGAELRVEETPDGLLLRRADPVLSNVYVEPTSACNLNCRTCMRRTWGEPIGTMEAATYRRLIDGLRDVPSLRRVAFWGFGEPLLHPQIAEMVALAKELGAQTELITNGLLLNEGMAAGLVSSGLDTLVISVDGASPEAYCDVRAGADLGVVLQNVQRLHELCQARGLKGPEVGIEFVLMKRNASELPKLRRLAHTMGASFIVVSNLLPYSEEMKDEILYWLAAKSSYSAVRSVWEPEIMLPRVDARGEALEGMLGLLRNAGAIGFPERPGRAGPYCRFVNEGAAAVAWDGGVSPCVPLMHSYPCYILGRRKQIRRYAVGNVASDPIGEIWQRQEYARFRKRVIDFEFAPCSDCGGCTWAESNEEDCIGSPFPTCGDCLWAKGVIQCP